MPQTHNIIKFTDYIANTNGTQQRFRYSFDIVNLRFVFYYVLKMAIRHLSKNALKQPFKFPVIIISLISYIC